MKKKKNPPKNYLKKNKSEKDCLTTCPQFLFILIPKKLQEKRVLSLPIILVQYVEDLNFKLFVNFIKNQTENESYWQKVLAFFKCFKMYGFYAFALKIVCKKVVIYRAAYGINFLFVQILKQDRSPNPLSVNAAIIFLPSLLLCLISLFALLFL